MDGEGSGTGLTWHRGEALEDWDEALKTAHRRLMDSSTRLRLEFLTEELLPLTKHANLSLSQVLDVFELLTHTYPRYIDQASRDAVEGVGMELIRQDELLETKNGVTEQILGWMTTEVGRIARKGSPTSHAAMDVFVLLNWACGIYSTCLKASSDFTTTRSWAVTVGLIAILLDLLLSPVLNVKPNLRKTAVVRCRGALRSNPAFLSNVMKTLLDQTKTSSSPLSVVPLLGLSIDVASRLKIPAHQKYRDIPADVKERVISFYSTTLLVSKTPVHSHVVSAFDDFIRLYVQEGDLGATLLPVMEKALIRSPENCLSVIGDFFRAYSQPLDDATFRRLFTPVLSAAKSSNPLVQSGCIALFTAIVPVVTSSAELGKHVMTELLALPKTGKTTGADHRFVLYSMLAALPPSDGISPIAVDTLPGLLAKETYEPAIVVLRSVISPHLSHVLLAGTPTSADVYVKEMTNSKPVIRRAFSTVVGEALWQINAAVNETTANFVKSILSALENALKTVSANPTGAPAGPLEAYVATAVMLSPLLRSGPHAAAITSNAVIASLASTAKPSFLVWDRVYQKIASAEEEKWLLRASEMTLASVQTQLLKNEVLRVQLGSVFVHLAVNGSTPQLRRDMLSALERLSTTFPEVINRVARDAVVVFISKEEQAKAKAVNGDDSQDDRAPVIRQMRLSSLLYTCAAFGEDTDVSLKQRLLADLVIVAHHAGVCGTSKYTWIELSQKAGQDPHRLVVAQLDRLIALVLEASNSAAKGFPEAAYRAASTLTLVAPGAVLPRVQDQLIADLNPSEINGLSDTDLGIWATPADQTYVDVLSNAKGSEVQKKGKGSDLAKWDAEVRQSLASKKATTTLTKQQQALVQAQREKEAQVRQRVAGIKSRLERGLHLVGSIVDAGVDEIKLYVTVIAGLLIQGALNKGPLLVGNQAFQTYLKLADITSARLAYLRPWIGVAVLRGLNANGIPEEYQFEKLSNLVLRVLYRLRTLSEASSFEAATFSYASPLLNLVLNKGGIGIESEEDDAGEQIILVLDIINFHASEFHSPAFPRAETMKSLTSVIASQPQHAKAAAAALADIGEAMYKSTMVEETELLINSTLSQDVNVRRACLQALQPFDLTDLDWSPPLFLASHDEDEQNERLSQRLWEDNGLDVPEKFLDALVPFLDHGNAYVRASASKAMADAVEHWPQSITSVLNALEDFYREKAKILAPEFNEYGMVIESSLNRSDPWSTRVAIGETFKLLAPMLTDDNVEPFFGFLIQDEALGDRHPDVRRAMLASATAVVDAHGASRLASLLSTFEARLSTSISSPEADDQIKEAVIILLGRAARHLAPTDKKIPAIIDRLFEALKTPAEQVQIAVSECLAPLVKIMPTAPSDLISRLLDELFTAPKYAARRGAAYGLAGAVNGLGIGSMQEYNILAKLKAATEDKKKFETRQGAMFAFETLSHMLKRLFEPYVLQTLPILLSSFGDSSPEVRDAAQDAARVIMGNMSGFGVKTILPDLLSGLDEKQWRTKKGSIELLGMMAFCAPRQLSQSLPIVIPQLTGVLTDSHAQVRSSADKSLKQFGEVISNPEIQALVPVLLKALVDPERTPRALTSLLKTSFMHYIDQSSLALVMPIIERGLRERGADTKKKAARIVGNLASLTDAKDFVSYLPRLLPMIQVVLVDPVPEARATAAKSLGALVERLGEIHFPDLIPSLLRTLKTDTSGVDRQGAAQGLSEVLSGLGMERMEGLLPDIIVNAQSPRSTVREGFMSLLVYLPATFGVRFQPHLPKIIAPILSGLSDGEEYVRDAAMKAGRMIITNYSTKAVDLLLPELERGMFDPGWRIRQSSITLIGELLFKISGISGKTEIEEDDVPVADTAAADNSKRALAESLGAERRDRILAALYLARQDSISVVRQTAIHIWKALVHNTPRTVREILPELIGQLLGLLVSSEAEQQETASRTMGELCRKSGEKVLTEVIVILRAKSTSSDPSTRQGVALGLSELVTNTTDAQREDREDEIIAMVRVALVDDDADVRAAAAQAFDVLQEYVGNKAIDQTIPTLLDALRQPGSSSGTALQALKEVMSVRASTVFPVLIPTLTASPMSVFNARALGTLVTVAGSALSKRLTVILNALVKEDEGSTPDQGELREAITEAEEALLESIEDPEGLNTLMMLLLGWVKHESPQRRVNACNLFSIFCEKSELDASIYRIDWIRQLVSLMDDRQVDVHTAAWKALDVFVKSVPKDDLESLVVPLRRGIEGLGSPGHHVPGFSLPKGVTPTVSIIIAGLTTGSNEQREAAAYAISDLVERTEESAIKPFVVPFTGPLIRVATQATAYPPGVKNAILTALKTMLERIPAFVKPFFPQLQRTFVKSASDPSSLAVRNKACEALGVLMKNQPRVDPVVTELLAGVRSSEEEIASSLIQGLAQVVRNGGSNVGEKAKEACVALISDSFRENHHEGWHQAAGALFAALSLVPSVVADLTETYLIAGTAPSVLSSQCILATVSDEDLQGDNAFQQLGVLRAVAQKVLESTSNERPAVARPAREARELIKQLVDDSTQGLL